MRVEESVEINRPSNEVFDYVANPQNLPEWSGLAIEVKDVPEPLREGDTFTAVGKFLGRRFETSYERVSVEANRHIHGPSHRRSGPRSGLDLHFRGDASGYYAAYAGCGG